MRKQEEVEDSGGEAVKVAVRVRPLNSTEAGRGDATCVETVSESSIQIDQKGQAKQFSFDYAISTKARQDQVFEICRIEELIQAAFEGYSATIFAYGQTGSGKTYTMAGQEDMLANNLYTGESEGIIPRAVRLIWDKMSKKKTEYFVKSSFLEIYNEQIRDLLNPSSGNLSCRWNSENGFFVEDLIVVDCVNTEDMAAVMKEGMRNRKIGSHELNKDSSRSHSVMTVYVISSVMAGDQTVKKYGKISFVDLAGSERLKESKSQGGLVKETGNINRSLFTLGKVINGLAERKTRPYIPYRDSKLTMLLMDSLGGTSKALMIACVGPSALYVEESLNTLNYAARTMNIKNKPVLQMDSKDQLLVSLIKERDLLQLENQYLRQQLGKAGRPLPKELKPLLSPSKSPSSKPLLTRKSEEALHGPSAPAERQYVEVPFTKLIQEFEYQIERLQKQARELNNARDINERNQFIVKNDNNALMMKLDNLEEIFVNQKEGIEVAEQYVNRNLIQENSSLKQKISEVQERNSELQASIWEAVTSDPNITRKRAELGKLKSVHNDLLAKIQYLQTRERELMEVLANKMK